MRATHYRSCNLCEATCGVAIDVEGDRVVAIRGDEDDPFSRGYICPKATALADLHADPDRLRHPMLREGSTWRELGWDEAFDLVTRRLREVRAAHGPHAIATYQGNPSIHSLGIMTHGTPFLRGFGTRNAFSATSIDQLPHMLAALLMYGNQLLMPVPDIDRTDYFLALGANPVVSNGSIMTAPDARGRIKAIRARGGTVVVVDPRRTETAEIADRHVFIRPGTDSLFLLSLLHVLYAEDRVRPGRLAGHIDGLDDLGRIAARYAPEATAAATGIAADEVRRIARELAAAPRAVCYGRVGVCLQEFGGLAAWLVNAVNIVTGRLDAEGGSMFTTPAIDIIPLAERLGMEGGFARWRSRVRGLPEFGGELPVACLAEEIATPGKGQIRALITVAGNPVLSAPNGASIDGALPGLDFMVSIDPYLNETTRHAHVILPPTSALERSHYDLGLYAFAVRNVARYSAPLFERGPDQRHDWEIAIELATRIHAPTGALGQLAGRAVSRVLGALGPEGVLEIGLRAGPHGLRRGRAGLSMARLRREVHGIDLGPLEPRMPGRLATANRRLQLVPPEYRADLARLDARRTQWSAIDGSPTAPLMLIGRRQLRSNNSWMHNSQRLVKGKARCTLIVHPRDAAARGLAAGDDAVIRSAVGAVRASVEISDEVMPGVVSLPHGWGHHRNGTRLSVAQSVPGVSINDVTDEAFVDALSGNSALNGLTVHVERAVPVKVAPRQTSGQSPQSGAGAAATPVADREP